MSADKDYDLRLTALTTEARHPESTSIDALTAIEIAELMNAEDATIAAAVATQVPVIAEVIEVITDRLRRGGRLIYMGAGTSGRLGVLDAAECPPTFNTRPEQVVGLIAGGRDALVRAVEGAEDHPDFGRHDLQEIHVNESDVVVGIATSGRTPYVLGGLAHARGEGAFAVGLSCNRDSALAEVADRMIVPVVGPELISGSTRLKAGTATKLVLNMLSTGAMVRLGKTYGNLMVDLRATNQKLTDRSRRIVAAVTGASDHEALSLLRDSGGEVKTAIVMRLAHTTVDRARQQLESCGGQLRAAVESIQVPARAGSGSDDEAAPSYVLGVDGGGSKTVAWLASRHESDAAVPLGRGTGGPANPQAVGPVVGTRNIARAIAEAFADAAIPSQPVAAVCLAIAGTGREDRRRSLEQWARSRAFAREVTVITDADAAVESVNIAGPLVTLIAGTGSICLARDRSGTLARSGGWGYLMGDEGSGYAIGLAVLRASAHAHDGRCPQAIPLRDALLAELGLTAFESLVEQAYGQMANDREQIARLAKVVLRSAEDGEAVSQTIVQAAARDLADMVCAVVHSSRAAIDDIAFSGGLLVGSTFYREEVKEAIGRRDVPFRTWHVVTDPVVGAVLRARKVARMAGIH